jgi:predicted dehydrogenase
MGLKNVNQQARQMDAFAECIRQDRPSRVSGEEGLRDLEVIEGIYESIADGGRRVELS